MNKNVQQIVILGGGSAGWLTAGILAAEHKTQVSDIAITLIESPNISPIGVGEGTWPSMRNTLEKIGISEHQFIQQCGASFKQGSLFIGWKNGEVNDQYYHPFTVPINYTKTNCYAAWKMQNSQLPFAEFANNQAAVCQHQRAPKQLTTPEYAGVTNYGYHLDAGKFSSLLQQHCVKNLGVRHILDNMTAVHSDEHGYITALSTEKSGDISADLLIDCTGSSALLIGKYYKIPILKQQHVLFNDSALAAHVPYTSIDQPINSETRSTAQSCGWIWDIGLANRKGVGYTYSSSHITDELAERQLKLYIAETATQQIADKTEVRKISFTPGFREKFWHKNCVAIGMASGFLEPLEASALAMIELSANMISEQIPQNREHMHVVSKRYNDRFRYRWQKVIEFLKLHYIISQRNDSDYWRDNRLAETIPESLQELLIHWQYQPPDYNDLVQNNEIFPSASYQFVLYGMGFNTNLKLLNRPFDKLPNNDQYIAMIEQQKQKYLSGLPTNRALINHICQSVSA